MAGGFARRVAVLRWSVTGATSITLEPGIGEVGGTSIVVSPTAATTYTLVATSRIDPGIGPVANSGTVSLSPAATTTYRLTATNPAGTAVRELTVFVPSPWCGSATGA